MQYEPQSTTEISTVDFAGTEIDGQFLIRDVDLGARMGLAQPLDIRRTIVKNRAWLEDHGPIRSVCEMVSIGSGAEREVTVYYLNEPQALSLCLQMRTPKARALYSFVVRFFLDRRCREAVPKPRLALPHPFPQPDPVAAVPLRLGLPALKMQLESLATAAATLADMKRLHVPLLEALAEAAAQTRALLEGIADIESDVAAQRSMVEARLAQHRHGRLDEICGDGFVRPSPEPRPAVYRLDPAFRVPSPTDIVNGFVDMAMEMSGPDGLTRTPSGMAETATERFVRHMRQTILCQAMGRKLQ